MRVRSVQVSGIGCLHLPPYTWQGDRLLPYRQDDLSERTQPLESSSMFRITSRSEVQDFDFPAMTDDDPDATERTGIVEEEIAGSETE